MLGRIHEKFGSVGLELIGPTRRYGYLDEHRRKAAARQQEMQHLQVVLDRYYSSLSGMQIPVSERNFDIYGVSTTPTLVLVDRSGVVRLYHPGKMSYRELALRIGKLLM